MYHPYITANSLHNGVIPCIVVDSSLRWPNLVLLGEIYAATKWLNDHQTLTEAVGFRVSNHGAGVPHAIETGGKVFASVRSRVVCIVRQPEVDLGVQCKRQWSGCMPVWWSWRGRRHSNRTHLCHGSEIVGGSLEGGRLGGSRLGDRCGLWLNRV